MLDICTDNRFELIEKYKQRLIEATNIEDSLEEMAVIDNVLFRFWQMGWLDKLDAEPVRHGRWENYLVEGLRWKCSECGSRFETPYHYCPNCGANMDGERVDDVVSKTNGTNP